MIIYFIWPNFRYKNSSNSSSRRTADTNHFDTTTAVNLGYIYADRGSNHLPYDYPFIEANGAQASSATTFQPQISGKLTNRNSTDTYCYIEMSAQANGNSRAHPVKHAKSKKLPTKQVSPLVNGSHIPAIHNHTRTADAAEVNTTANTNNDSDHVISHS